MKLTESIVPGVTCGLRPKKNEFKKIINTLQTMHVCLATKFFVRLPIQAIDKIQESWGWQSFGQDLSGLTMTVAAYLPIFRDGTFTYQKDGVYMHFTKSTFNIYLSLL